MHRTQRARAYQPITPANNMILKKKWDQTRFDMHRMKVCLHCTNLPHGSLAESGQSLTLYYQREVGGRPAYLL